MRSSRSSSKKTLPGRPLAGVAVPFRGFPRFKVLDFSKLLPGPYATQILADMGCKVTRVELPYFGDLTRDLPPKIDGIGSAYWMVNQGKKLLSFDFRKPAGLKRLRGLIRKADVLVEGFRPGLMERIGLGYEEVSTLNPRLIYCSITGYPAQGEWARKAGHDLNFMAVTGFLGLGNCEGRISFPSAQLADLAGSFGAVIGILGALLERRTTGHGKRLTISIAEAFHSWLAFPLGHLKATGEDPSLSPMWWGGTHPFYRLYDTSDGRKLAVGAVEKAFALALLDALGLGHLKDMADRPIENAERLTKELERTFKSASLITWEARLKDKDVCVSPVYNLKEAASFLGRIRRRGPASGRSRRPPGKGSAIGKARG